MSLSLNFSLYMLLLSSYPFYLPTLFLYIIFYFFCIQKFENGMPCVPHTITIFDAIAGKRLSI
jgi:hypothetical protein